MILFKMKNSIFRINAMSYTEFSALISLNLSFIKSQENLAILFFCIELVMRNI